MTKIANFSLANAEREREINPIHHRKLVAKILMGEEISFILPAFPAKSGNRNKTYSQLPDYGEVVSLQRLNEFALEISQLYQPGVKIIICSDGRVF